MHLGSSISGLGRISEHTVINSLRFNTLAVLNADQLRALYRSAIDTSDGNVFVFSFDLPSGVTKRVTEQDMNTILHFPIQKLDPDSTTEEIHAFFTPINESRG